MVDDFVQEIQSLIRQHYGERCDRIAVHVECEWSTRICETGIDLVHIIYWVDGEQLSLMSHGREQALLDLRKQIDPLIDPIAMGGGIHLSIA